MTAPDLAGVSATVLSAAPLSAAVIVAVALPLAGAVVAVAPRVAARLAGWLWVAPLPALALAIPQATGAVDLPWLLLETRLANDDLARPLLAMTAVVWVAAGLAAPGLVTDVGRPRFVVAFLAALGGNLTVLLAADLVTFYAGFAVLTYAGYALVAHERTATAWHAARAYLAFAVLGEALLLAGLALAAAQADSLALADVAAGLGASPHPAAGLLLAGFGVKAGLLGLHSWLPLAHPAAPVPASAVLSGCLIKAGVVGWVRLLPLGEIAMPVLGGIAMTLGLLGVFVAAVLGALQHEPKTMLAYSSVSQIGLVALAVGAGAAVPEAAVVATGTAALFVVVHGFAKATLFLGTGVAASEGRRRPGRVLLAGQAVAALVLAGAPLGGGMLVKEGLKEATRTLGPPLGTELEQLVVPGTGAATALLLGRVVLLLAAKQRTAGAGAGGGSAAPGAGGASARVWSAWGLVLAGAVAAPWLLLPRTTAPAPTDVLAFGAWVEALWPLAIGLGTLAVVRWPARAVVPAGDLLVPLGAAARRAGAARHGPGAVHSVRAPRLAAMSRHAGRTVTHAVDVGEALLGAWRRTGLVAAVLLLTLLAALVAARL